MDTPGYPRVPHTTPSSTHAHRTGLFHPKRSRPPVLNPFDKFSQQDFDVWIGKLTGDLEKALGYEEVKQPQPSLPQVVDHTDDEYDESDSYVEDSFAEVKARRVLDKGKARDPREGPGLGPKSGDIDQPIELLSDEESEGEGEEQSLESEGSVEGELDELYEQGKEEDGQEGEEGRGQGSDVETRVWSNQRRGTRYAAAGRSTGRPSSEDLEQAVESGESGSDEYEEDEVTNNEGLIAAQGQDGVIRLISDEEAGAADRRREEEEFLSGEGTESVGSSPAPVPEQEDESKLQDEEDMQPSDEDTSFPPRSVITPGDIRDPWAQVAKYAEDYYAEGEVVSDSRHRLSPDHLGIDEDHTGFLTPDVVNPDVDEEGEEGEEGEDEFEDEFAKDHLDDMETQEFELEPDENDHLFNRLRPYTQPKPLVYSPWRGPRTSFFNDGPGSNEEPILIDSDEEPEEECVTVEQHPKATPSDDVVRSFEEAAATHEDERSPESCDQSMTIDAQVEPHDKERIRHLIDERVQSSTAALGHLKVPSLLVSPESSIIHEIPVPARADTGVINEMPYVNLDNTPKGARIYSGLYTHGLTDTSNPLSHSNILDSTPGLQSESNALAASGGNEGQALDRGSAQLDVESHSTTHPRSEVNVSGQNTTYKEVDEEMDELDELDELDDAGPWPLMTSDLDYPLESQAAQVSDESVRDSIEPSETLTTDANTQVLEVEHTEHESISGIHIFVEEADEHEPGTSFQPITINVQGPTPLIMPESEFEGSPTPSNETGSPNSIRHASISEPPPVTQPMTEELDLTEKMTGHIADIGSNDDSEAPDQKLIFGDETLQVEVVEGVAEVRILDAVISGEQGLTYVVQEPTVGSKLDDSAGYDRDISIDITSVPPDDIISTVEAGYVEDVLPDTDSEEKKDAVFFEAEAEGSHVEDLQSFNDVPEDIKEPDVEVAGPSTTTEAPMVTRAAPEVVDEDYFAHPSTPIMSSINFDMLGHTSTLSGNLPSIIQLPDTPHRVLSPGSTPAPGPTPVSIAVEPGILKVLKENPSLLSGSSPSALTSWQPSRNSGAETTSPERKLSNIENTITQQTSSLQPPFFKLSNHAHPESSEQLPAHIPTFLPVTTTVKPVLYVDPYPYSLSTPLPYHQDEDASEDATDQDNSFSSPSLNEREFEGTTVKNAAVSESSGPVEEPKMTAESSGAQLDHTRLEQYLMDVEVEADALIDEFLVDEPESDTDADGEADPEFTTLESSVSARSSEGIVDKESEGPTLLVTNANEESGTVVEEVGPLEETKGEAGELKVSEDTRMQIDEHEPEDPFKLMGTDSLIAPGEAPDVERIEKSGEEKIDNRIQEADEVKPLDSQPAAISEHPAEVPSTEFAPESLPSSAPLLCDTLPGDTVSTIGERMESNQPLLPILDVQHNSLSEVHTSPTDSAQPKEEIFNLVPEHTENTQARSPVTLPRIKTQGMPLTAQESRTEGSPRRLQVSLEDPYNADNDSDREPKSKARRAGKRKRSLSEVSNGESPIAPRSASVVKGKGKTSSHLIKGVSRPRKKPSIFSSGASRSPSVASTAISDVSSLLSPSYQLSSSDPRPFIHAHSRRKLGNAPTTVQQQRRKQPGSQDGILRAENVLTKAPAGPLALGSSPMTRSHCRYHKISIPKTENGPRIHFLVPGCSLNDAELIEEEEIEDHGEAIIRGDTVIADKIETINFEPYLLWAMRQLVGTELLRENEVYYLPEPDETIVRSTQEPKKKGARPSKRQSKGVDGHIANPSQKPTPPSLPSDASSVGSAASVFQQVMGGLDDDDMSSITETEEEDIPSLGQQEKEAKQNTPREIDVSSIKDETSTHRRRGRRLGQDAAAYYPSTDEESGSNFSDNTKHRSARNRGVKRPRGSESNVSGADRGKIKKPRRQSSPNRSLSSAETNRYALQHSPSHLDHPTEVQPTSLETMVNAT